MASKEEKINKALDLIFTKYDEDHNNSLDVHELQKLLKELYPKIGIMTMVTEDHARLMMSALDKNKNGVIDRDEIRKLVEKCVD